jgi:hypothetical protein
LIAAAVETIVASLMAAMPRCSNACSIQIQREMQCRNFALQLLPLEKKKQQENAWESSALSSQA